MDTQKLIKAALLKATGKSRNLPTSDKKYIKLLDIANLYIQAWQNEPYVDWASLYEPKHDIGEVTATNTYTFDPTYVRKVSDALGDTVLVQSSDYSAEFEIVAHDQLGMYSGGNYCAVMGSKLVFARDFSHESPEFGGRILVPIYTYAPLLSGPTDNVPVDNPLWLVVAMAAEYVRSDTTLQGQYGNLVNEANALMQRMIDDNNGQVMYMYQPGIVGVS